MGGVDIKFGVRVRTGYQVEEEKLDTKYRRGQKSCEQEPPRGPQLLPDASWVSNTMKKANK